MNQWTKEDLQEFDALTWRLCSHDQLERIKARLELRRLEKRLGKPALDEMFAVLKERDNGED